MSTIFDTQEEAEAESRRLFREKFGHGTTEQLYGWLATPDGKFALSMPDTGLVPVPSFPEPAQPEPAPADPTQALIAQVTRVVQIRLDSVAQQRGYDGILSACTYVASAVPRFKAEAEAAVAWRDAVWSKCYEILAQAQAGERAVPSLGEVLQELPQIQWPQGDSP